MDANRLVVLEYRLESDSGLHPFLLDLDLFMRDSDSAILKVSPCSSLHSCSAVAAPHTSSDT